MNKKVLIINNILYILNFIILFSIYFRLNHVSFNRITFVALLSLILVIMNAIQLRKQNKIFLDRKYNIMFLITNLTILFIFLRDMFDKSMNLNMRSGITVFGTSIAGESFYLDYNITFIIILYILLITYNTIFQLKKFK